MAIRGNLFLLGAAFLWGTTFVAQAIGMDSIGPFLYAASRYLVGTIVVALLYLITRSGIRPQRAIPHTCRAKGGFYYGLGAGCIMLIASSLQQISLLYTTVGKASFITCLYIVFVPIAASLFGKRPPFLTYAGTGVALAGLYLLSIPNDEFTLVLGDVLLAISAVFWTMHILFIAHFAPTADAVEISLSQLVVCTLGSAALALLFEDISLAAINDALSPILYAGVMSSGIAFTLQILGQKIAPPASAAVIMSLEAVFGAVSGVILLGEVMTIREVIGCVLMFIGMVFTQLSSLKKTSRVSREK